MQPEAYQLYLGPAIGLAVFLVFGIAVGWHRRNRHRLFLRLADELGFRYLERDDTPADPDHEADLRRGLATGLLCDHVITGARDGFNLAVYDQTQSQIVCSATLVRHTVVEVSRPGWRTPEFVLQPEGRLTRGVQRWVEGDTGVKFGDDLDFSRHNYLRSGNDGAVRTVFSPAVRARLQRNRRTWIQGTGEALRFYRYGERLSQDAARDLVTDALDIAQTVYRAATTDLPPAHQHGDG